MTKQLVALMEPAEVLRRCAAPAGDSWFITGCPEWLPVEASCWAKPDHMSLELTYLAQCREEKVRYQLDKFGAEGCIAYLGATTNFVYGLDKPWHVSRTFLSLLLTLYENCNFRERRLHYLLVYHQLMFCGSCEEIVPPQ